jgi:hypothetical protein
VRLAGVRFAAEIRLVPSLEATLWMAAPDLAIVGLVENVLRVMAAHALLEVGGTLIHSAAVVEGDRALLFYGPSGVGKSTIAALALAAGRAVLSDDLNAVLGSRGVPRVEPVPFAGDLAPSTRHTGAVPLGALCRLRRDGGGGASLAAGPAARRISAAAALASLLAATPFLNADPWRAPRLEEALLDLLATVPALEVAFDLDAPFDAVAASVAAALR